MACGQHHILAALSQGKARCSLYRRLPRPRSRCWGARKASRLPVSERRSDRRPAGRYGDYANPAAFYKLYLVRNWKAGTRVAPTDGTYWWHLLMAHTDGTYWWHLLMAPTDDDSTKLSCKVGKVCEKMEWGRRKHVASKCLCVTQEWKQDKHSIGIPFGAHGLSISDWRLSENIINSSPYLTKNRNAC